MGGIQVVLPNFTALPLPEFNLLWTDRIGQASNNFIYIEIDVYWRDDHNNEQIFVLNAVHRRITQKNNDTDNCVCASFFVSKPENSDGRWQCASKNRESPAVLRNLFFELMLKAFLNNEDG